MRILHMFNWNVKDVINELPIVRIQGFDAIQISPVQPMKSGDDSWWLSYQTLGFSVGNKYGSKEDYSELFTKAGKLGIKIIVDVVLNHVASKNDGSIQPHEDVDSRLLNPIYYKSSELVTDWNSRDELINKSIGLPSLDLSNSDLQDRIFEFLYELINMGVGGFRFDAAKHIHLPSEGSTFWDKVSELPGHLFNYAEVIYPLDGLVSKYQKYINVLTESNNWDRFKLVKFVESHDSFYEFKSTRFLTDGGIMSRYNILCRHFPNTLFFCRPFSNLWKDLSIRFSNYQ